MTKIRKMEVRTGALDGGADLIEIYAFAEDEAGKKATLAYELCETDETALVYDGWIVTSDPGVCPMDEYADRDEAIGGGYGAMFKTVFGLADGLKAE